MSYVPDVAGMKYTSVGLSLLFLKKRGLTFMPIQSNEA